MKILYIGPYKSNETVGDASLDIIDCLSKKDTVSNLTIRPIYIDADDNRNTFLTHNLSSKKLESTYDLIIQHAPIGMLSDHGGLCKKSVAIPLFTRIINSKKYIDSLSCFDMVLTDDHNYTNFLSKMYNIKNIQTFSYTKMYSSNLKKISFFGPDTKVKFYSILNDCKEDLIEKLLVSFYYGFGNNDECSFVLIINKPEHQDLIKKINALIDQIKKKINHVSNIDNLHIILKSMPVEELVGFHNSCDIYIDIENNNHQSKINRYIANQLNKPIIIEENVICDIVPFIHKNNSIGEYIEYCGYHNIVRSMSSMINNITINNNSDNMSHQDIASVLCQ